MKKIKYCIPSYNRACTQKMLEYILNAKVYVSPQDYENYCKGNPQKIENFVVCPDGIQGTSDGCGKINTMNYILDTEMGDNSIVVIMDDDVTCMKRRQRRNKQKDDVIARDEIDEIVMHYSDIALGFGCGLWGISANADPLAYSEFCPFNLRGGIVGAFLVFVKDDGIRFDKRFSMKDDRDMCLQQLMKYHKCMRVNRYYLDVSGFKGSGGVNEFRNNKREEEQYKMMVQKWGQLIKKRKNDKAKWDVSYNLPWGGV